MDDFFVIILCHILRLNASNSISTGAPPQTPLGELTSASPDHLDLSGSTSKGREGKERERRGGTKRGREEKGSEGKSVMEGDERTPRV